MFHNKNPKGSEWNIWDLHVHTPASVLSNNFGNDWDKYVKTLFKRAYQKKVFGLGITDYYTIDGYKRLREEYLENDAKLTELFEQEEIEHIKNMLVIPNIEFRIDKLVIAEKEKVPKWNRKVNFHLLFSDQISIAQIEDLLGRITFEVVASNYDSQHKSLRKEHFIELGKELQIHQPEFQSESPLFVGMINACVNIDQIASCLKADNKTFGGKYLFGLPADEDLNLVDWASAGHLTRKNLLNKSHVVFSSNRNTAEFCLGLKSTDESAYIKEFGSLKPCIWGSDAHDTEKLLEPDQH